MFSSSSICMICLVTTLDTEQYFQLIFIQTINTCISEQQLILSKRSINPNIGM